MRSVIFFMGLVFCGFSFAYKQDLQPGDVPINVGSLQFIRRPLSQRVVNTVSSSYVYPSPRLEYISAFGLNPLKNLNYQTPYFSYYVPSFYNPLGSQVYTHYPHLSGGPISPIIITTNTY